MGGRLEENMKIFEYIDRINLLNKLIKERKTGTLDELAERLHLSKSRMCRVIEDLKLKGAPIEYSRCLHSYYFTHNYQMKIEVVFKELDTEEVKAVNGGQLITNEKKFLVAFFCAMSNISLASGNITKL